MIRLTARQRVLLTLLAEKPRPASSLAAEMMNAPETVAAALRRLQKRRLVRHAAGRRSPSTWGTDWHLTAAGREAISAADVAHAAKEVRGVSGAVDSSAALALALAASAYGVDEDEVCLPARGTRRVSAARRCIWAVLRTRGFSLPQIAEATGHDHTSVLYGLRVFDSADRVEKNRASACAWTLARRLETEDTPAPSGAALPAPPRGVANNKPPCRSQQARKRPCITCGREFASEGSHNRMCRSCKNTADASGAGDPYAVGAPA